MLKIKSYFFGVLTIMFATFQKIHENINLKMLTKIVTGFQVWKISILQTEINKQSSEKSFNIIYAKKPTSSENSHIDKKKNAKWKSV